MGCDHPIFEKRSFKLPCREQRWNVEAVIILVRHNGIQTRVGAIEVVRSCLTPLYFEHRISLRDWVLGVSSQGAKMIPKFWL